MNRINEGFAPLENYKYYTFYCNRCGACRTIDTVYIRDKEFSGICPIFEKHFFAAYSAQGMMEAALAMIDNRLKKWTPKLLDILYKCTLCGGCDIMCKRCLDLEPLLVIESLRIKAVLDGIGPLPEHIKLKENIEKSGNIYAAPINEKVKLFTRIRLSERARVLYFIGCGAAYKRQEIANSTIEILNKANIEFTSMEKEKCCGYHLLATGQIDTAKKLIEQNLDMILKSKAEIVVTSCAACYKTIKVDYPKLLKKSTSDLGFEVLHITEFIDRLIKEGRLRLHERVDMKVTYHDPCSLGRLSEPWEYWEGVISKEGLFDPPKKWRRGTYGVYEPPRNILKSIKGINFVEMRRVKENTWCCGAGGGVKQAFPDFASWVATKRLEEAKATGSEAIVTACPFCKENFEDAIKKGNFNLRVFDIIELVAQTVGG